MRTYRFYGMNETGANALVAALREDGMASTVLPPTSERPSGWGVEAEGEKLSEGLLESLAHVYGGHYEGEGLAGA